MAGRLKFEDVQRDLASAHAALEKSGEETVVHLGLPKWESESSLELIPTLQALGVVDLFEWSADLSGMSPVGLFIGRALHQANITVDESGTEAAAATALVAVPVCACGPPEVTLTVDRPFIYLITDDATGEILFVGRVLDPTAG